MVWTRLTTVRLFGALLALPVAAAGLYTVWQATFSAEASCRSLRTSILSVLERNVDETVKYALVHKDLTEFERACALRDPEARAVFSAFDRTILFTAGAKPVRFVPPSPAFGHRWPGVLPPPPPPEEFRRRPFGT
jgi:hypothetical protein